jgi:hypothetical protein
MGNTFGQIKANQGKSSVRVLDPMAGPQFNFDAMVIDVRDATVQ